jgi:xanthine permease XanP
LLALARSPWRPSLTAHENCFRPSYRALSFMAVGLELGKIAASVLLQHTATHSDQTVGSFATAVCTLAAMAGLAVWATGLPKLFCSLIGILVGYGVAAIFDVFPPSFFEDYKAASLFAVPDPSFLSYAFAPSFAAAFVIAGLASGLRVIGVLTTCQQMNDAAWRRPDVRNIAGGRARLPSWRTAWGSGAQRRPNARER